MQFVQNIDDAVLAFIQNNIRCSVLDYIMPIITSLGDNGIIWIVIAIGLIISKRYRKYGISIILALAVSALIGNMGLKPLIARARPFVAYPDLKLLITRPLDFSFPSGHTMASFASAVVLSRINVKIAVAAYTLAGLISFSRIYLYVHYPSDVLAGMFLGIIFAIAVLMVYKMIENKIKSKKENAQELNQ